MKGLSEEIKVALETVIEGLEYDHFADDLKEFNFSTVGEYFSSLDSSKMQTIMKSKIESFNSAKLLLSKWMNSPNSPSRLTAKRYIKKIIKAGEGALSTLRTALKVKIDYNGIDPEKHAAAVKAKAFILESIFELNRHIVDLQRKLESGDLDLTDNEFKIGYPERFANQEFYPEKDYFKDWKKDGGNIINIAPDSSEGEIIIVDDLKIQLPKKPSRKKDILFSNLPVKDQYWRRLEVPDITPENVELYSDYILEEFRRRREGVWFMNNGKPEYITGNHYFALQWMKMFDNGDYMNFRKSQQRFFYFLQAVEVDTRSLGLLFLKSRRTGFTYMILSTLLNKSTSTKNAHYGMTSKTEDDVEEVFAKFSYAFLNLPFFFRPVVQGKEDSKKFLYFGKPSDASKKAKKSRKTNVDIYLNTIIDFRPTKNDSYDSIKLDGYLGDEIGKWKKPNDYIIHLGTVAPTMMPNGRVVGKAYLGSTMGKKDQGGSQFVELINSSKLKDRDPLTGKTPSALYFHFLPAHENMEEFTDKYGYCHTKKPDKLTYNVFGDLIENGSEDYLKAVEEQKKRISEEAYSTQLRTYPRTIEHAIRDEASEGVFNSTKLYEQIEHNNTFDEEDLYTIGNFEWVDGIIDGDVEFIPSEKGRFKVSWLPTEANGNGDLKNNVKEFNGLFYPLNDNLGKFGCDPFSIRSENGKGSKGALHFLTEKMPDGVDVPKYKFTVEYIARPDDERIFFEDVIKVIRYYGSPILVESNRIDLLRHMRNRGYRPFSMNRLDKKWDKLSPNEKEYGGQTMSGQDILDSHMNAVGYYINSQVGIYSNDVLNERPIGEIGEMPFNETLVDWLKFDPTKRTKHDPTISSGLAIMAVNKNKYKKKSRNKKNRKFVKRVLVKYNNKGDISSVI